MAGQIFTDRVTDITYQYILPVLVDNVSNSNVFTSKVLSNTRDWEGISYNIPIQLAFSTTGGPFNGMDTWPTAATNNTRQMTFYITGYEQSVVIPGIEAAVNGNTESQVIKLLTAKMDEAKISMADSIGTLLYGFGLGKAFDGLGNIVDNGTNAPTYGGLSRTTYPLLKADVTPVSGGTITLAYLSSEFDNVSAASSTTESPTLGLTDKADWTLIEELIQPMLSARYDTTAISGYDRVDGKTPMGTSVPMRGTEVHAAGGFISISWRGRPMVADDKAPSGTFFWINEKYLFFAVQRSAELRDISSTVESMEGFYEDVPFPSAFQFRDLMSSINQLGQVGGVVLLGNLMDDQPRRDGKLTGITGN
jgi:hypothetical protein